MKYLKLNIKDLDFEQKKKIKNGEFVIEYVGEMFRRKDSKFVIKDGTKKIDISYMLKLDDKNHLFINASKYGGIARYMNHSCDPNCKLEHWIVGEVSRAAFFATKDIECLEELTFNYDWKNLDNQALATQCHCQSKNCKGTIQSLKKKPNNESEKNAVFANEAIVHDLINPMKQYTIKESVIPLGFKNEKNSCYIDSALHMLFSITSFMSRLANNPPSNPSRKKIHSDLLSLYEIYILNQVALPYVTCDFLVKSLNEYIIEENINHPEQKDNNNLVNTNIQSDSHEFLIKLIDSISDENNNDFMNVFFEMKVQSLKTVCCFQPPETEIIRYIEHTLPITENDSIDGLLREKFAVEEN